MFVVNVQFKGGFVGTMCVPRLASVMRDLAESCGRRAGACSDLPRLGLVRCHLSHLYTCLYKALLCDNKQEITILLNNDGHIEIANMKG
jgi:hypothetical protein